MDQSKLDDIVAKAKRFMEREGLAGTTSFEQVMIGFIVNRGDLIGMHGYTMVQAIELLDQEWLEILPEAQRQVIGPDLYNRKLYGEDVKK
ncbi:hypothetical protein [Pannonibacter phragmitetus]|jgi:hypothetical protein|uniref:hypothetical protein n=1 Tax=Pannonibacter phragmitetus TaxID=121719 RepID=UPI000F0363C2|nr:hypothetical protein [Pannonibacter phragmitetus]